jgi:hypothetical protein
MPGAENSGPVEFPAGQARYVLFSNVPEAPLNDARVYFTALGAIRAYDSGVVSDFDSCVGHFFAPSRQLWKRLSLPFFNSTVILSISRLFVTCTGCFFMIPGVYRRATGKKISAPWILVGKQ